MAGERGLAFRAALEFDEANEDAGGLGRGQVLEQALAAIGAQAGDEGGRADEGADPGNEWGELRHARMIRDSG